MSIDIAAIDELADDAPEEAARMPVECQAPASVPDMEDEAAYAARPLPHVAPSALLEGLAHLWEYPKNGDSISAELARMKQEPKLREYADELGKLEDALFAYEKSTETVVGAHLSQLDYTRLFIGSFKMYAPPYASYYVDGADQIFGPTAVAVEGLYAQFGLEIKSDEHDMPDHIRYLLVFMALLARTYEQTGNKDMALAYEDFKHEFLDSWSAEFSEKVHTYTEYAFYPALVDFTLASV